MRKIGLIAAPLIILLASAANLFAATIDTSSERDTIYDRPKSVVASFGKLLSSGEIGVFLHIQCRVEEGENDSETLFYRLDSEVVFEDDILSAIVDGKKRALARKSWLGWKTADGVTIHHSRKGSPHPTFTV